MRRADSIKRYIAKTWSDDQVTEVCSRLIDYIVNKPNNSSNYLTYGLIRRIVGMPFADTESLVSATSILSARFDALHLHFVYIDDLGDEYRLDDDEAKEVMASGCLHHPRNGHLIEDIQSHLYPYYSGNKEALEAEDDE